MKGVIALLRYCVIGSKTKDWLLCILSAILLILSFPKFNLWILAWFAFIPLLFAVWNKTSVKAFLLCYFTGIIFWFGIIYWLIHVTALGLILLILYLSLYFGIFGLIISLTHLHTYTLTHLLFIPSAWVLLEYLRSHLFTGFPWALLGYSQYLNLPVIQIADVTGAWGVSFLVMMMNVFFYKVIGKKQKVQLPITNFLLPVFILFLCLGYGLFKLYLLPITYHHLSPIKISIIQGNIPQTIKWQAYAKEEIFQQYLSLSRGVLKDKPDLIIWPEAAMPAVLEEEPIFYERLSNFIKEINTPLLFGAVTFRNNLYYNSALLLSYQGKLLNGYDKLHLVPFGEYIPLKRIFSFLETVVPIGDFTPGKDYTLFSLTPKNLNTLRPDFSVLICFEDIFPDISRQFVKQGADFLVNITNDAWFGDTSAAYQHLQASIFRAVENQVYLLRAANTGVSGFVTPQGKIYPLQESISGKQTFVSAAGTRDIIITNDKGSFYNRWGDVFVCLIFAGSGLILRLWYKKK